MNLRLESLKIKLFLIIHVLKYEYAKKRRLNIVDHTSWLDRQLIKKFSKTNLIDRIKNIDNEKWKLMVLPETFTIAEILSTYQNKWIYQNLDESPVWQEGEIYTDKFLDYMLRSHNLKDEFLMAKPTIEFLEYILNDTCFSLVVPFYSQEGSNLIVLPAYLPEGGSQVIISYHLTTNQRLQIKYIEYERKKYFDRKENLFVFPILFQRLKIFIIAFQHLLFVHLICGQNLAVSVAKTIPKGHHLFHFFQALTFNNLQVNQTAFFILLSENQYVQNLTGLKYEEIKEISVRLIGDFKFEKFFLKNLDPKFESIPVIRWLKRYYEVTEKWVEKNISLQDPVIKNLMKELQFQTGVENPDLTVLIFAHLMHNTVSSTPAFISNPVVNPNRFKMVTYHELAILLGTVETLNIWSLVLERYPDSYLFDFYHQVKKIDDLIPEQYRFLKLSEIETSISN